MHRSLVRLRSEVRWSVARLQSAPVGGHRTQCEHVCGRDGRRRHGGSEALQADALDFLGDTLTYGMSLAVIGLSLRVRATAALIKGATLALMGLWVLGATVWHVFVLATPRADVMGLIGFLALAW
jgi:hypothetical protein